MQELSPQKTTGTTQSFINIQYITSIFSNNNTINATRHGNNHIYTFCFSGG